MAPKARICVQPITMQRRRLLRFENLESGTLVITLFPLEQKMQRCAQPTKKAQDMTKATCMCCVPYQFGVLMITRCGCRPPSKHGPTSSRGAGSRCSMTCAIKVTTAYRYPSLPPPHNAPYRVLCEPVTLCFPGSQNIYLAVNNKAHPLTAWLQKAVMHCRNVVRAK